jgi:murein DD-endopeptidase MepM/ murein hydrolase activator NlpD
LSALPALLRPIGRHGKRPARRFAPALPVVSVALAVALGVPLVGGPAGTRSSDRPASLPLAVAAPIAVAAPRASTPAAPPTTAQPAPQTTGQPAPPRRAPAAAPTRRVAPVSRGYDEAAENRAVRAAAGADPAPRRATAARADRSRRQATSVRSDTRGSEVTTVVVPRGQWARPASGVFTSGFKWRWGRQHKGIDIAAPLGTPIYAATDGVVVTAGWNGGYGKFVLIQHSGGVATAYGHNTALLVRAGQRVRAGQQIARMGSTGRSTGSHCHFEVRINGTQTDPVPYLARRGVRI